MGGGVVHCWSADARQCRGGDIVAAGSRGGGESAVDCCHVFSLVRTATDSRCFHRARLRQALA